MKILVRTGLERAQSMDACGAIVIRRLASGKLRARFIHPETETLEDQVGTLMTASHFSLGLIMAAQEEDEDSEE